MARILHLSDLHLLADESRQQLLFRSLLSALRHEVSLGGRFDLVVVTGDVFESALVDRHEAVRAFSWLHRQVMDAAGGALPTVVLPGNHDRRDEGYLRPYSEELFHALQQGYGQQVWIHGCTTPFLARLVPQEVHRLPVHLVAYDSTYLPEGLVSAGGFVRQEDLLQVGQRILRDGRPWPVVVLLHHHLIPTPLTDLGKINTRGRPAWVQWVVGSALPWLVAHGDREEPAMMALGAGTALSTLHTLGRAVLVMHGHKHYPTVRLLRATHEGEGDVLLASAGSAGVAEKWTPTDLPAAARLWPSFNVVELGAERLRIDTVAFPHLRPTGQPVRRTLVEARLRGAHWEAEPVVAQVPRSTTPLELNEARYVLQPDDGRPRARWDLLCRRQVQPQPGVEGKDAYVEVVEGIPGSRVVDCDIAGFAPEGKEVPTLLRLPVGRACTYRLLGGLCRTVEEAARVYGPGTAFEWVALLDRFGSRLARLSVEGLPEGGPEPFGSCMDLTTGLERPVLVDWSRGRAVLELKDSRPRSLLRLYWPLEAR